MWCWAECQPRCYVILASKRIDKSVGREHSKPLMLFRSRPNEAWFLSTALTEHDLQQTVVAIEAAMEKVGEKVAL